MTKTKEESVLEQLKADHKLEIVKLLEVSGKLLVGLVNEYALRSVYGHETVPLKREIEDLMEVMLLDKQRLH